MPEPSAVVISLTRHIPSMEVREVMLNWHRLRLLAVLLPLLAARVAAQPPLLNDPRGENSPVSTEKTPPPEPTSNAPQQKRVEIAEQLRVAFRHWLRLMEKASPQSGNSQQQDENR